MNIYEELSNALQKGNRNRVVELIYQGLEEGCSHIDLLNLD